MKILHISNDFCKTKVHSSLYKELDALGIEQTIYNPVRDSSLIGKNQFEGQHTNIVYSNVVKPYHKYLYHVKRHHVFQDMKTRVDISQHNLCHATTLLTDGGLAWLAYKKYNIPYIVAVRSTDIDGFLNYLPNTWMAARKILSDAKKIIFITEALRQNFINHRTMRNFVPAIQDKFVVMPNGINDYYLNHLNNTPHSGHKVVYMGLFSNRKNVARLIEAVLKLKEETTFQDITLTLIGGGKNETDKVEKLIAAHPDTLHFVGPIYEQDKICEIFAESRVFAMPSIHETFGLVYIEALSQNLPVLYTKRQGIDGLFSDKAGIAVNPLSVDEIAEALRKLLSDNYYSNEGIDFAQFRWNLIAKKYAGIYNNLLGNR